MPLRNAALQSLHGDGHAPSRAAPWAGRKRLGFFTRLLDDTGPAERYRLATEQIVRAEAVGFDSAWIAQHHFDQTEGGLPAPFPFLAHVAAHTSRIRLGTGVVTLPMENPIRVAEDAAVLDLLSGGRLEIGFGSGGNPSAFAAFGQANENRADVFGRYLRVVLDAWRDQPIENTQNRLYPPAPQLLSRVWYATFSAQGGARAGEAGFGLMLSRTQPRSPETRGAPLSAIQDPIVDAYLATLPAGVAPRILGSRTVFVAEDRATARSLADQGLRRSLARLAAFANVAPGGTLDEIIAAFDVHVGTPDDVIASLRADRTLARVTDLAFQVHSVDPPHPYILRSLELIAETVAPALGWEPAVARGLAAAS